MARLSAPRAVLCGVCAWLAGAAMLSCNHNTTRERWEAAIELEDVRHIKELAKSDGDAQIQLQAGCDGSSWTRPLHLAVGMGKPNAVAALLESGANPNAMDSMGRTAFFSAVDAAYSEERINCLNKLLGSGGDINRQDSRAKWTVLHFAVVVEQPAYCRYLVEMGADVTSLDESNRTPLEYAKSARSHVAKELIDAILSSADAANHE